MDYSDSGLTQRRNIHISSYLLIVFFLIVTAVPCTVYGAITETEREALIALYNSTDGDNWTNNTGWKDGDNFAVLGTENTWYGVIVTNDHVTEIDLDNNNLTGNIPPEIGNLTNLTSLELHFNHLSGSIPAGLWELTNLTILNLRTNYSLSGNIPPEIGNLENVTELYLSGNELSGSIPPEIGNLKSLTDLYLDNNQLTGELPHEIGNITTLRLISLCSNGLSGTIPDEIYTLPNLYYIDFAYNRFSGYISPNIGNLTNLSHLELTNNQLFGNIPAEIGLLTKMNSLNLSNNQLSGNIPPEIGNLTEMKFLFLYRNHLSGAIPEELGSLSNLQNLVLYSNQLIGSIPSFIGSFTNLMDLELDDNLFDGNIPSVLGNLSNLEILALRENQLSGTIPPELGNLTKLKYLLLGFNELTGTIPSEICNITGIEYLDLQSNQLEGPLPSGFGNLINLLGIWLSGNQLTGRLPESLGSFTDLTSLCMDNNRFSGNIPSTLGSLSFLEDFKLSSNQLVGEIPVELSNLNSLKILDIGLNALYTDNTDLNLFLQGHHGDWQDTQTIAPENITTGDVTETTVAVQWSIVDYTSVSGNYIVSYSATPGGPYTYFGATASKLITQMTVTGLELNTRYYFVVQTQTDPHANNQNIVVSDYSEEVTAIPILDLDDDKMPDDWEIKYFSDLSRRGDGDYDNDGLSDLDEYTIGTKPDQFDSDGDGLNDGIEIHLNTDPNNSGDFPLNGSITGTIYYSDGSLLTGASVKVIVQLKDYNLQGGTFGEMSALSDPDTGTFVVNGIPVGYEYYVAVDDPSHNLTTEYYTGDTDDPSTWIFEDRFIIAFNADDNISGIDFKVEEAGIISGNIRDLQTSEGLENINIVAYVSQCGKLAGGSYSLNSDSYTIHGLPLGTTVYLRTAVDYDLNYIDVWYDSDVYIHECEGAEPVVVGEATIADFYLEQGETISGSVMDKNTGEGVTSWVTVYTNPCNDRHLKLILTIDGTYTIKGLVPGELYYIKSIPLNYHLSQWYNMTHLDLCENATAVQAPSTDIDFEVVIDVDHDKISDEWETEYFNSLNRDGSADYDADGLSDLEEYQNGTNPTIEDTDSDSMPDGWEVSYGFNPIGTDAGSDYDDDGLSDLEEYQNGTDPTLEDTDSDGMPDEWEVSNNLNPLANDTESDKDGDGYSNLQEYRSGTNPDDINNSPKPPVADAGEDQTDIIEGETVTLFGSNSTDPDDGIESYFWEQIDESSIVILSDDTDVVPTFVTPPVDENGITLTFKLTVTDKGGLTSEDTVSIDVDDNGIAGFPENVITFSTSTNETAGCAMEEGGDIVALDIIEPSMITATLNRPENLIYGLMDFNVKTEEVGGTAKITIYLPSPAPAGYSWYKYSETDVWIDFSSNASFNAERDQVTLTLTDGGTGDDDGVANGIIVDPSGLGSAPVTPVEPDDPPATGGGGGGGGSGIFGNIDLSELTGYHLDWTERDGTAVYMPVTDWIKALKGAQTHVEGFAPGLANCIRENFDAIERKAKSDQDGFLSKTGTYLFPVLGKVAEFYLYAVDSHELMDNAYKNTTIPVIEFDKLEKQGAAVSSHVVTENSN